MNRFELTRHVALMLILAIAPRAMAQNTPTPVIESRVPAGEPRMVSKIAVSADGSKLAVSRGNAERGVLAKQTDSIELWPLRGSQAPISFATGLNTVESLVFSHDAQWLGAATQSPDEVGKYTQILVGDVRLWHANDGVETKLKFQHAHPAEVNQWSATNVAFSADDRQLVANVFTPGELPEQDCPSGPPCGGLESIPYEVRTTFFDVATGRAVNNIPLGKSDSSESEPRGLFWLSSDGRRAMAMQEKLTLVNTLTGREVGTFKPPELRPYPGGYDECKSGLHAFGFAVFSNDGKQIAVSDGGELQIVDARTGASTTGTGIFISNDTSDGWLALAASFSPNGETLAVAACDRNSDSGELLLYNTSNLKKAAEFRAARRQLVIHGWIRRRHSSDGHETGFLGCDPIPQHTRRVGRFYSRRFVRRIR
jgi:WD40 repeat protein